MNTRNFLRLLRAAWRDGVNNSLTERLIRAGVYPSSLGAVARRDPAAAEGDARLGGEIRRSSPQAASYPRPGVPAACLYRLEGRPCRLLPDLGRELWCPACRAYADRTLVQVRHLLELIAGKKCSKVTGGSRCWDDPGSTPDCPWGADRWCDACTAQVALDALTIGEARR